MADDRTPDQSGTAANTGSAENAGTPVDPGTSADPGTPVDPGTTAPAPVPAGAVLPPVIPSPALDTGYTAAGVPTLDGVREKIETRYGTALGATELAEESVEGRSAAQRYEARQQAAADKLEEIRASMPKKD